ncbi:MAG TPA: chemotaxis protein CheA [Gemmatimonadales bacterium]|nr:chemotaxis protein CheA [Gemmatimonadales bacterium]
MSQAEHPFAALLAEYVAECLPLAEDVAERVVALERGWRDGTDTGDLARPLKGTLHTIKGNSAMMGLVGLQTLAHRLEDLWGALLGDQPGRDAGVGLLVRGAGLLADLVRATATAPPADDVAAAFIEEVDAYLAAEAGAREPAREERRSPDRRATDRRQTRAVGEIGADGAVTTIRVESQRLDALLETFGEVMIAQAGLRDAIRQRGRRSGGDPAQLERAMLGLDRTLKRLEQDLMETRLLPISTVFTRFTRLVRDLAHGEGKEVRLEVAGGETRLDKTVIDRLGEPLVHLLTNAVIHGIETPDERTARGKPAEATITLRAVQRSDRVILTVTDDGRGLDPDAILRKARALGHAPAHESPSRAEIFALAFLPGLSTRDTVSHLSGRGVGLDVVASSIRALSGNVAVGSEPGRGTTFSLRLPLTVAVLRALLVEVGTERYAVPLADVAETVRVAPGMLHQVVRQGMMTWRGEVIPVLDGGRLLGGTASGARACCVVLRSAGERHRGLLVDALLGHQEVVVKALDPALGRPPAVAAATILGDGRVACILDSGRVADGWIEPVATLAS